MANPASHVLSLSLFLMHALFTQRLSLSLSLLCLCTFEYDSHFLILRSIVLFTEGCVTLSLSLSLLHAFTRMLLNENVCAIRDDQFSLICPTICASLPASFFHWCRRRCSCSCKAFPSIPSSSSSPSALLDANSCRVSGAAIGSHSFLRPLHASPLDP